METTNEVLATMETMETRMKTCKKCSRELPIDKFNRDKMMKDGHKNICKECHNAYQRERNALAKGVVKDAPKVSDPIKHELEQSGILAIPPRLLISALRYQGYRGTLKLVIEKEVVI